MRATGTSDPRDAMVHRALVVLREAEVKAPPIDLPMVASFQGVREIEAVVMPQAGRLVPRGDGLVIQVNADHTLGKRNFTIGHEIGHTFLPDYQARPRLIEDLATGLYEHGSEEEHLCDIAAAELLMPMALFRPLAAARGFDLATVAELAQTFDASREATAIRLVETDLWPCALAIWHRSYKPAQRAQVGQPMFAGLEWAAPEKMLRVRYAVASSRFGHYLHPHLAAEPDGCLVRCLAEGRVVYGEEQLKLRDRIATVYVMAAPVFFAGGGGEPCQVVSLLLSDGRGHSPRAIQPELWATAES
jgi:hypothetical protein